MTAESGGPATIAGGQEPTGLTKAHARLLAERGLPAALLAKHGVASSPARGPDWVEIPYIQAGRRVNAKYRTIGAAKAFTQDAGAVKCFWNVDVIADPALATQPLIITEGEFDALAAMAAGFSRVVSVPDGAPAREIGDNDSAKYTYLDAAPGELRDIKEIILATDGDGPGINLMNDLAIRLGRARCKWVRYPVKCKDLNDALMRYGQRGVVETLSRARWMDLGGLYRMSELPPIQPFRPYMIGIEGMQKHYNIREGDFAVVTGIPGFGKTAFVNEVAARMAVDWDWTVLMASFEQRPQIDHRRNLRTFFNRKLVKHQAAEEIATADAWIERKFVFLAPGDDDNPTLQWVLERCQAAIVRYDAKLVVIDPWNEMDHTRPPDMTLTEYTGFAIKQFRKLATRFHVHVIVVAHPAKMHRNKDGTIPIPTLYDISDSSHWANKADVGIVIHRDDQTQPNALIRIVKTRYADVIGVPGELTAIYHFEEGRFEITNATQETPPYLWNDNQ